MDAVAKIGKSENSNACVFIVGCGGVGSRFSHEIVYCFPEWVRKITFIDHDTVEAKNLKRQPFYEADLGKNKADCLNLRVISDYAKLSRPAILQDVYDGVEHFYNSEQVKTIAEKDWLFCFTDTEDSKLYCLAIAEETGCNYILAANEDDYAESFYYNRAFKDTPYDLVRKRMLLKEEEVRAQTECALGGEQTALANWQAALCAMKLFDTIAKDGFQGLLGYETSAYSFNRKFVPC